MEKMNTILRRGAGGMEQEVGNSMIQCFNTMIFRFFTKPASHFFSIKNTQCLVGSIHKWGSDLNRIDFSTCIISKLQQLQYFNTHQLQHSLKFLVLLLLLATTSFGQASQTMEAANEAYTNKNYDAAIQHYEQLLSEGYSSEVLHYNLGNAYYRTQQLAEAILHYEKALQVAPSDEDILHNLQVANAQQLDEMEEISAFFLSQWWKGLRSRLSTGAWTTIGLLLLWGSAAGFIFWLMAKKRTQRKRGFLVGVILFALCILPFLLALDRNRHDRHSKEAILMAKETQLHFAPDSDSEAVRTIHEGLKVDLQDKISAWYKVRLPNGEVGWLPEEVVEEI